MLTVVGTGVQARGHLAAFAGLRRWREIRLVGRSQERAERLAAAHPGVTLRDDTRAAVSGADVVALCTSAVAPVVERGWLAPGAHLSSVGSGPELPAEIRVAVEWRGAAAEPPPAGAAELQGADPARLVELGEIVAGTAAGRRDPGEITVYKSTGHAVEDAVAARLIADLL